MHRQKYFLDQKFPRLLDMIRDNPLMLEQCKPQIYFSDFKDVILAYQQAQIDLHTFVWVRFHGKVEDEQKQLFKKVVTENYTVQISNNVQIKESLIDDSFTKYIRTTPGRILLNEIFH